MTQTYRHGDAAKSHSVVRHESAQAAAAILDGELGPIGNVRAGQLGVVLLVGLAGKISDGAGLNQHQYFETSLLRYLARDPEVAGSSVKHNFEGLGWCADLNIPVVSTMSETIAPTQ